MKIKITSLDRLFSKYIHLRDKHCQRCGSTWAKKYDAHHYVRRRNHQVRWDEDNSRLVCFGCHSYLHQHADEDKEFFKDWLGKDRFDILLRKAQNTWPKPDKEAIKIYLTLQTRGVDK